MSLKSSSLKKEECNYLDTARFIGIYLVVFAHVTLTYQYSFISYMIYTFHMPLFFLISGILHKDIAFSKKSLYKTVYSLVFPFILYNGICYIYLMITQKQLVPFSSAQISDILTIQNVISGASWFFIVLFWIKLSSLFIHTQKLFIIISIVCLVILSLFTNFLPDLKNYYLIKSAIMSFPYFAIGYLIKDRINIELKLVYKIFFIIASLILSYYVTTQWGSISIGEVTYNNIIVNTITAVMGSIAVIFLSQIVTPYIKCNFVKDMSRGTMIIVGLHFFIMFQVLPSIFGGPKPITHAIVLSIILFLAFYPIIKLTYNRIPILYGKRKNKS